MNTDIIFNKAFEENPFRFYSKDNVLNPKDLGIASDRTTLLIPESGACKISSLQSCPWTATAFSAELFVDGESVYGYDWIWLPNAVRRKGKRGCWEADTVTVLPPEKHGGLIYMELRNCSDSMIKAPVELFLKGSARKESQWEFGIPWNGPIHYADVESSSDGKNSYLRLVGGCDDVSGRELSSFESVIAFGISIPNMIMFRNADIWETDVEVPAGEKIGITLSFSIGDTESKPENECKAMIEDADNMFASAFSWLEGETERILSKVPTFRSDDPELEKLYIRSLVTYSLNRWDNPLFAIRPFISTGSVNGGCMCSYLWDYGGGLMLHPLVDPEANKNMIRAYLHDDLTTSFAIQPLDGGPSGLWYHINQEKIIAMIYYHVLHTGDKEFLNEVVDGKTITEWAVFHALLGDDISKPQKLIDYGDAGKSHLELRRKYYYKGIMPDLNARRYLSYMRAYELTKLSGDPMPVLVERAEALIPLLATLWDDKEKWYDYIWEGKKDKRYTVQMYKFINSPVIDEETRKGLVSHLNETEFLSKFGLHSISKTDPGYDQIDIDNGGGGICTLFTMQIAGQLYDTGYSDIANDIIRRVRWWGTRLPYWGDSCAANVMKVREDTPLQADISSTSCAQMIIFNLFGIKAELDGKITVSPAKTLPSERISLENVKLLGRVFTVKAEKAGFSVKCDGKIITAKAGEKITL